LITGIGSFPFTDANETIDIIFSTSGEIPFWPQLPKRSPEENMYSTFIEGVPSVVTDKNNETAYINTEDTSGIEQFYENVFNENLEAFRISEKAAPGFYRFLERLKEIESGVKFIKGQLTGPFSMGLGLKDEKGKPIIYNFGYFDIIKKALNMKAKWMVAAIKKLYPEKEIIIFFDEPYLVSFGSAYVSISKNETISLIDEVISGVNAKRGIHCCGNTDWSVLLNTGIDIINYDAFNFLETIFYYKEELVKFFERGGWISPGIVPSSEEVLKTTRDDIQGILAKFNTLTDTLGLIRKPREYLITTSCGLGSLSAEEARRAMELLKMFQE
jgi:methionine synthase II (cobalamin-independent)